MRALFVALALGAVLASAARAAAPAGRYVVGVRSVEDRRARLVWRKVVFSERLNWSGADAYCQSLQVDGGGWRLPTLHELQTLVDAKASSPAIDTTFFPDTPTDEPYWTSVPGAGASAGSYWTVHFSQGRTSLAAVDQLLRVRCVKQKAG